LVEFIGLQSARGRLFFFATITIIIYLAPYHLLGHLSIWQALHIPSPSIGLTRAYHLFLHGDFGGAWERNKLIYLVFAVGFPVLMRDGLVCYQQSKRHKNRLHNPDNLPL
jgi:hypothetical protein